MSLPSIKNRVGMSVSGTPGTGTITLASAESGYQSFATAYGANANVDVLVIDGSAWEVARDCAYTHSGTTLSRGTLEASSTGSVLSLTSAAKVYGVISAQRIYRINTLLHGITPGGRLTLTSGTPVTTSDVTSASTIYYTPYVHDNISLWDGTEWVPHTFTETSLAIGTVTASLPYDVFAYSNSGTLTLEKLAWTSTTARATAVSLQDGRYCKSGDKTRLYLGTFYPTSTTTTEDSSINRFLWNAYNRVVKHGVSAVGTTHTYSSAAYREWNNGSGTLPRVNFIAGLGGTALANVYALVGNSGDKNSIIRCYLDTTDTTGSDIQYYFSGSYNSGSTISGDSKFSYAEGLHYITIYQSENATVAVTYQKSRSTLHWRA